MKRTHSFSKPFGRCRPPVPPAIRENPEGFLSRPPSLAEGAVKSSDFPMDGLSGLIDIENGRQGRDVAGRVSLDHQQVG